MKKDRKRFLCLLLAIAMVIGVMPVQAAAEESIQTDLTVTARYMTNRLSWNADGVTYAVERSEDGLVWEQLGTSAAGSWLDTDAGLGTRYFYRLTDGDAHTAGVQGETTGMAALKELRENTSSTIVTMVNTLEPYSAWEALCGEGRLLPAFPGAGGSFEGNVLHASLTPWIVQPTTFGEIDGRQTERTRRLAALFRKAHIPYQKVADMHAWQLSHLAMVVPIADAYYEAAVPEKAGEDKQLMQQTAQRMQQNFRQLKHSGVKLSPKKMHLFRLLPKGLLSFGLGLVFRSRFGHIFMYQHSMNAPDEMRRLHEQFYGYLAAMPS